MCDYLAINSNFFDYCTYALVKYFQLEEYAKFTFFEKFLISFQCLSIFTESKKTEKSLIHTYTDSIMPTRTICISEEAYEKLKSLKPLKEQLLRCYSQVLS